MHPDSLLLKGIALVCSRFSVLKRQNPLPFPGAQKILPVFLPVLKASAAWGKAGIASLPLYFEDIVWISIEIVGETSFLLEMWHAETF